ncbi:MAG: hypothetical protein M1368_09515, partial [Thaumarchaeota archaeon]|nr:hypothetical protein [Nitrososphaerota archaeon]
ERFFTCDRSGQDASILIVVECQTTNPGPARQLINFAGHPVLGSLRSSLLFRRDYLMLKESSSMLRFFVD